MNETIPCCPVVAVHGGAGKHNLATFPKLRQVLEAAVKAGYEELSAGSDAIESVSKSVSILEDSPLTNAGLGSSLNSQGSVECDCSVSAVSSQFETSGAVGCVKGIKNPSLLAKLIAIERLQHSNLCGLVRPAFLVGDGAVMFAREHGIEVNLNDNFLITSESRTRFLEHSQRVIQKRQQTVQIREGGDAIFRDINGGICDTVGGCVIDKDGICASMTSSGGISLKHPGRIGEAAVTGSGCLSSFGICVSCSGIGEEIMDSFLASKCIQSLSNESLSESHDFSTALKNVFGNEVDVKKRSLRAGCLCVVRDNFSCKSFICIGHSLPSFAVAFTTCPTSSDCYSFLSQTNSSSFSVFVSSPE